MGCRLSSLELDEAEQQDPGPISRSHFIDRS
jgi:hypothetical protein